LTKIKRVFPRYIVPKVFNDNVAFISSANSLGFMDGGSDLGYMNSLPDIQRIVQNGFKTLRDRTILDRNYLCIGNIMGFKLSNEKECFFISAPTMFLPQKVFGTDNAYIAFKSALQLSKELGIKKVYCPMMCSNYGGFSYKESYDQMKLAVENYNENPTGNFKHHKQTTKSVHEYRILC
jgi:O-acetyl-ADP-ribose deacetylase (regulator of RNase III)